MPLGPAITVSVIADRSRPTGGTQEGHGSPQLEGLRVQAFPAPQYTSSITIKTTIGLLDLSTGENSRFFSSRLLVRCSNC